MSFEGLNNLTSTKLTLDKELYGSYARNAKVSPFLMLQTNTIYMSLLFTSHTAAVLVWKHIPPHLNDIINYYNSVETKFWVTEKLVKTQNIFQIKETLKRLVCGMPYFPEWSQAKSVRSSSCSTRYIMGLVIAHSTTSRTKQTNHLWLPITWFIL